MTNTSDLSWPLVTIDFEASSLDEGTYPIEVGLCRWTSPDHPIEGWSTLIRPTAAWLEHGSWSPASQEVHGIRREELDAGMTPHDAVNAVTAIAGGAAMLCDGLPHDLRWAQTLARASGISPRWVMGDFDHLAAELDQIGYMRMLRWMERAPPRHRARDDAERLMKAFARGLGIEHGTSTTITPPGDQFDFDEGPRP